MSITILKAGISDTIQDGGRYGYQHIGIQPKGYLDAHSAKLANLIVGNALNNPLFEIHFPSSRFYFNSQYIICITGAHFVPLLNDNSVALNTPILVKANDTLQFLKPLQGRIAYVAIQGKIEETPWLNSHSFFDKRIKTGDEFKWDATQHKYDLPSHVFTASLSVITHQIQTDLFSNEPIRFIPGPAWHDLSSISKTHFVNNDFKISSQANRMGYPIDGPLLHLNKPNQYLSAGVTRGTLQLLPNGKVIVLMADHQTIGGYANLGQIILVDLPRFAQLSNKTHFQLMEKTVETAHQLYQQFEKQFIHRS